MNNYFDTDAETAVLSLILKNPSRIYDIKYLEPNMFSSNPNQHLFSEMKVMMVKGLVPEPNLLVGHLEQEHRLDVIGGVDYIKYLVSLEFDVNNLLEFEKIVHNSYLARTLVSLSTRIPDMVTKGSEIFNTIDFIRNSIDKLCEVSGGNDTSKFEDALKSAWNRLSDLAKSDNKISFSTGLKSLDAVTGGYLPGDLWIVAGRPGMGKTSYLCNSILTGTPTLVFSREMSKESLIYRMLSIKTGIPAFNIRFGLLNQNELDIIAGTIKEIKDLPIYIDTNFISDIGYVVSTVRKYKRIHGINTVHVDYIQLLAERDENSTHELGQISRAFKMLSNDLSITSIIYSQLNRLVELRTDKRPVLSDLRQSGNLEEDADLALFLYRDVLYDSNTREKDLLELLLRKHRNGPTGVVMSTFDDNTNRISERK